MISAPLAGVMNYAPTTLEYTRKIAKKANLFEYTRIMIDTATGFIYTLLEVNLL